MGSRKLDPRGGRQILQTARTGSGRSAGLVERARELARLDTAVAAELPADMRPHCQVANLRAGTLVLAADSPAWAARLRFHAPRLLRRLRARGLKAQRVRVLIQAPIPARRETPVPPPRRLSAEAARLIHQQAEAIADPDLAAALRRLARRRGPEH